MMLHSNFIFYLPIFTLLKDYDNNFISFYLELINILLEKQKEPKNKLIKDIPVLLSQRCLHKYMIPL